MPRVQAQAASTGLHAGPALTAAWHFLRTRCHYCLSTSLLVSIPCWWQTSIQAGDLGSHVYNAWLADLIAQGKVRGLWIVPQWSNTLFDRLLAASLHAFGFFAGEKVVVTGAVLGFFWGVFAFLSATSGRPAWLVAPVIAAVSYGWVFSMGFMNLYMSLGFVFLMLALIWRGQGAELALVVPLLILISLAHILGFAAAICLGFYVALGRLCRNRLLPVGLAAVALLALLLVRDYAASRFLVYPRTESIGWMLGADQLLLYRHEYTYILIALAVATLVIAWTAVRERGKELLGSAALWLTALATLSIAVSLLPSGFNTPQQGPMGLMPERLSALSAVMLCCVLALLTRRTCQMLVLLAIVLGYFGLYYSDTAKLNRLQKDMERAVRQLPAGSRIVTGIELPGSRVLSGHLLDRACIGYCFNYANYEVGSGQFRIRGSPGNGVVTTSYEDSILMQAGDYVPAPSDPPLYYLLTCGAEDNLCIRPYPR